MSNINELFRELRSGKGEALKRWLEDGGDVNYARPGNQETPIMHAALGGHAELVSALLDAGADLEARDSRGHIPAHYAGASGEEATIRLFLEHGYGVNDDISGNGEGTTFLHMAAAHDAPGLIAYLIEQGAEVNALGYNGVTALMQAAGAGHAAVFDLLMRAGADPHIADMHGNTALGRAAYGGHTRICAALLDAGVDIDVHDASRRSALNLAAGEGHEQTCLLLIERGAAPDGESLLKCVEAGLTRATEQILGQKPELVHYRGWLGYTPLIKAVKNGSIDMLNLMLEAGADIDERDDNKGWTALMHASYREDDALIDVLKRAGADMTPKDKSGHSASDLQDDFYDYDT